MRNGDPGLGHQFPNTTGDLVDVVHAVMHEEHLTVAKELATDGLCYGPLVVSAHIGEDRLAVGRRCVEQAQVTDPCKGHLEGSGNRSGGEGQHVDVCPQRLDGLLVGDTEVLFLVNDK